MPKKIEVVSTLFKGTRAYIVFVDGQLLYGEDGLLLRFFSEAAARQAAGEAVNLGPWGRDVSLTEFLKPPVWN